MEFAIGLGVGVFIGWMIAEKPEWARNATDKIKGLGRRKK